VTKYIYLYEDYTEDFEKGLSKRRTWSDLRDSINLKKGFVIIDFEDSDAKSQFISSELHKLDYSDQQYHLTSVSGEGQVFPSVFVFGSSQDLFKKPMGLFKRFKIKRMIIGTEGKESPTLYVNGERESFGSDIMSGISPSDMGGDDYYQSGSTYYKFIN
jgi:hypothetical protein